MSHSPELHTLFLQLQARYPLGSLITELVQFQAGQYVVRAVVQLQGVAIASGLAAAATVEQAEDQARLRVLSWLGIMASLDTPLPAPPVAVPSPPFPTNGFTPLPAVSPPTWLEQELVVADIPTQPDAPATLIQPDSTQAFESDEVPDYLVDDSESGYGEEYGVEDAIALPSPAAPAVDELPAATLPAVDPPADRPKPKKATRTEAAIDSDNGLADNEPAPEATPPESDDLSSLIALTDIEMDRIGWSKQEGREYLKRTYKKSTRQRLDVDELMDFLNYLRALPSLNGL